MGKKKRKKSQLVKIISFKTKKKRLFLTNETGLPLDKILIYVMILLWDEEMYY